MKKTIQINLNNQIFYLDEDAYQILDQYLNDLKNNHPEKAFEEEKRISDFFQLRTDKFKQVITLEDVKEVIGENSRSESSYNQTNRQEFTQKKLYRDINNQVISGVSAGLAHYFGIDPVIIRVLFLVLLIFSGFGLLAYIILWIAMPPAITSQQRNEMIGSKFDYEQFKSGVRTEYGRVRNGMKDMAGSPASQQIGTFFRNLFVAICNVIGILFKVFGIALAVVMIIFGIGMFYSFLPIFHFHFPGIHFPDFHIFHHLRHLRIHWPFDMPDLTMFHICLAFVILVPVLSIVIWIFKSIFGIRSSPFLFRLTLFIFWILAVLYLASNMYDDKSQITNKTGFIFRYDTLVRQTDDQFNLKEEDYFGFQWDKTWYYLDFEEDYLYISPRVELLEAEQDSVNIFIRKEAYVMFDEDEAASEIEYGFRFEGRELRLNEYARTDLANIFFLPTVDIRLLVPENVFVKVMAEK